MTIAQKASSADIRSRAESPPYTHHANCQWASQRTLKMWFIFDYNFVFVYLYILSIFDLCKRFSVHLFSLVSVSISIICFSHTVLSNISFFRIPMIIEMKCTCTKKKTLVWHRLTIANYILIVVQIYSYENSQINISWFKHKTCS
jgi:hypothetical protein